MTIKKGTRSKESGPIKSFIQGTGGFLLFVGVVGGFAAQDPAGIGFALAGSVIIWLGSLIPDKNVVKW